MVATLAVLAKRKQKKQQTYLRFCQLLNARSDTTNGLLVSQHYIYRRFCCIIVVFSEKKAVSFRNLLEFRTFNEKWRMIIALVAIPPDDYHRLLLVHGVLVVEDAESETSVALDQLDLYHLRRENPM